MIAAISVVETATRRIGYPIRLEFVGKLRRNVDDERGATVVVGRERPGSGSDVVKDPRPQAWICTQAVLAIVLDFNMQQVL